MNRYLIYGTGKSGVCAGDLLKRHNKEICFFDEDRYLDIRKFHEDHPQFKGVKVYTEDINHSELNFVDNIILSPGVALDNPNVLSLKRKRKNIIGELELGFSYEKGKVIAITGTNGKTTTTALVGHILKTNKKEVFVGGNIGVAYTSICDKTDENSISVLEVSSFQLETIADFAPDICTILNLTPDHLDRHKTFEDYAEIKISLVNHLKEGGVCVLNYEDSRLRSLGMERGGDVLFFSSKTELSSGLFVRDNIIILSVDKRETPVVEVDKLKVVGEHNWENAMAATGICLSYGLSIEEIRMGLESFEAVEHRLEFVCEKDGVAYYNDSKGTNTDAGIKAIFAMDRPIILIGGGYDKKADYREWIKSFHGRVKHAVLIGESARDIAKCAESMGFTNYSYGDSLEEAVNYAKHYASRGDCILLSPACASWGMFKNFEERGDLFKKLVRG